jgi:hypothetical protein
MSFHGLELFSLSITLFSLRPAHHQIEKEELPPPPQLCNKKYKKTLRHTPAKTACVRTFFSFLFIALAQSKFFTSCRHTSLYLATVPNSKTLRKTFAIVCNGVGIPIKNFR